MSRPDGHGITQPHLPAAGWCAGRGGPVVVAGDATVERGGGPGADADRCGDGVRPGLGGRRVYVVSCWHGGVGALCAMLLVPYRASLLPFS